LDPVGVEIRRSVSFAPEDPIAIPGAKPKVNNKETMSVCNLSEATGREAEYPQHKAERHTL
jgi:hypothetical protein